MDTSDSDVNLDDSADIFANSSAETVEEVNLAELSDEEVKGLDRLAHQLAQNNSTVGLDKIVQSVKNQSDTDQEMGIAQNTSCKEISADVHIKSDVYEAIGDGETTISGLSAEGINISLHSTDTSFVLSQFVKETCNPPQRIYCPFCVADFGFEFLLKAHIKECHLSVLHRILKGQIEETEYHVCPFCPAKFYVSQLLPKHILNRHDLCTLNTFPSQGSPTSHLICHFCPYKVFRRHYRLLLVHIERKHMKEFESYIYRKYSRIAHSCDDLRFLDSEFKVTDQVVSPGLSDGMQALRTHDDKIIYSRKPLIIKPILKVNNDSSDTQALLESPTLVSVEDKASAMTLGRTACRKLRFDLPDSPLEGTTKPSLLEQRMKQAFAKKEKRFKWKFSLRRKKKDSMNRLDSVSLLSSPLKTTPVKSSFTAASIDSLSDLEIHRYKCGICNERFAANGGLVEHVRRRHKGIKLRSMYHCGECSAKFFRNSFLVQHCSLQHSPLCLNARSRRSIAY